MRLDGGLQLGRGHLKRLVLDQLLEPVDDVEVALGVGLADVAGVQPAVFVEHRAGCLRVVQVALHHLRSPYPDLAQLAGGGVPVGGHVDDAPLGVGQRGADRGNPGLLLRRVGVGDRARLGQAVTLTDEHVVARCRPAGHRLRQRRRAGHDVLQRRDVEPVDQRMLGQGEHDGRHEVCRRHSVLLQQVEEPLEVEARHRDDGGAGLQRGAHDHRHAVDVVEGQDADERVVGRDALVGRDLGHVGDQVVVRQHDALRHPRGAARIGQRGQVVARVYRHRRRLGPGHQRRERRRPVRLAEDEDLLHPGAFRALSRRVEKLRDGQEEPGPRILKLTLDLCGRVERVHRGDDPAGGRHAEERGGVLRQVGTVDGEHVSAREAACGETRRDRTHGSPELRVGQGSIRRAVDQRRLVGPPVGVLEHVLVQRPDRDLDVGERAPVDHRPLRGNPWGSAPVAHRAGRGPRHVSNVPPSTGITAPLVYAPAREAR